MTIAWIIWIASVVTTFAILEIIAFVSRDEDVTLTAHLRRWLGIQPRRSWRLGGVALVLGSCTWLAIHLIVG